MASWSSKQFFQILCIIIIVIVILQIITYLDFNIAFESIRDNPLLNPQIDSNANMTKIHVQDLKLESANAKIMDLEQQNAHLNREITKLKQMLGMPIYTNNGSNINSNIINITKATLRTHPFHSPYGNPILIHYSKTCYNQDLHRHATTAGLYNTGTNAFYTLLMNNCKYNKYMLRWQPQWGKHELVTKEKILSWDEYNSKQSWQKYIFPYNYANSVNIVIIKDPLTWIKSMCKANYDFHYIVDKQWGKTCPKNIDQSKINWVPLNRGSIRNTNFTTNGIFTSIVSIYNAYYENWLFNEIDIDIYPLIVVRFEDLLFEPEFLARKLCKCIGHNQLIFDNGTIIVEQHKAKLHGNSNSRTKALAVYSNKDYRYLGYQQRDLQYIWDNVNQTILKMFGYEFDPNYITSKP